MHPWLQRQGFHTALRRFLKILLLSNYSVVIFDFRPHFCLIFIKSDHVFSQQIGKIPRYLKGNRVLINRDGQKWLHLLLNSSFSNFAADSNFYPEFSFSYFQIHVYGYPTTVYLNILQLLHHLRQCFPPFHHSSRRTDCQVVLFCTYVRMLYKITVSNLSSPITCTWQSLDFNCLKYQYGDFKFYRLELVVSWE